VSSGAIRAARAFIEVFVKDDSVAPALERSSRTFRSWLTGLPAQSAQAQRSVSRAVIGAGVSVGRQIVASGQAAVRTLHNALAGVERRLSQFSGKLRNAALAGAVAAAPVGLAGNQGLQVFAGYQHAMQRVAAVAGTTQQEFALLDSEARRLGRTTEHTATDAAGALNKFAMGGLSVREQFEALAPTLQLASTGQIGITESADIATKILRGMAVPVQELPRMIDVMAQAMVTANTDLTMLGDAFKYVGPIARVTGTDIETITAAIQLLSDSGIQGEMAGTTLRGAFMALTDPSVEAANLMKAMGIRVKDLRGNFRGLPAILDDFTRATARLGDAERLGVIGKIFDARQAAGFALLIQEGPEKLRQKILALQNSQGTANRIASQQLDSLTGDWKKLTSAVEGVQLAVGDVVQGPLRQLAQEVTKAVSAIAEWIPRNRELTLTLLKWGAVALAIPPALLAISTGVWLVGQAFGALSVALLPLQLAVSVAGGLAALVPVVAALGSLLPLVATPVGALVAGLVGLSAAGLAAAAATTDWSSALAPLAGTVQTVTLQALGHLNGLWARSQSLWTDLSTLFAAGDLGGAVKVGWQFVQVEWQRATSGLLNQWDRWLADLEISLRGWGQMVLAPFAAVWNGIQAGFQGVAIAVGYTVSRLADLIVGLTDTFDTLMVRAANAVETVVNPLSSGEQIAKNNAALVARQDARHAGARERVAREEADRKQRLASLAGNDLPDLVSGRQKELDDQLAKNRRDRAAELANSEQQLADRRRLALIAAEEAANQPSPAGQPVPLPDPDLEKKKLAEASRSAGLALTDLKLVGNDDLRSSQGLKTFVEALRKPSPNQQAALDTAAATQKTAEKMESVDKGIQKMVDETERLRQDFKNIPTVTGGDA
jgi:TP901 family phage tail tape measure protein